MSFTVAPIHNLILPDGTKIPFGDGLFLQGVPQWVKADKGILDDINRPDRQAVLDAKHAFVAEYDSGSIGEPDPSWTGQRSRSIQDSKTEKVILANLALWLRQPSNVRFTLVFHALSKDSQGRDISHPIIQSLATPPPLYCHPNDVQNKIKVRHASEAGKLHATLCTIPRNNAVWAGTRALWAALTTYEADIRYFLLWIGLEGLFGANDGREIAYKLSQRIAFFIANTPKDGRELFRKAKRCYDIRSKIAHGRWNDDPEISARMADTEAITRTAFRHLLERPDMLKTFMSKHRDQFLEDWVFSRFTDPPPYPE